MPNVLTKFWETWSKLEHHSLPQSEGKEQEHGSKHDGDGAGDGEEEGDDHKVLYQVYQGNVTVYWYMSTG